MVVWLFHTSRAREATVRFTVSIESSPKLFYSARLNGSPYQAGDRCGLGSKTLVLEGPDTEPFRTNLFVWYSGADLGNIDLKRSTGTLAVEVAPAQNKVLIRGQHLQKEIANCGNESFLVPVGEYEVISQFEHFQVAKRITVQRNSSATVSIRPTVTTSAITAEPADAEFRFECKSGFPINLSGKTPAIINGLPTGKYDLTISRGKFQKAGSVNLTDDPTNKIHTRFDYAKVSFKSDPSGAEIRQGSEVLGRTPAVLSLIPGAYRLTIQREGFFPIDAEFDVKGDEQREAAFTLVNVEYTEAYRRAKSFFSGFDPDFPAALQEVDKALQIEANSTEALRLRDDIHFGQTIARARDLARGNDVDGALKVVNTALEKRPTDKQALNLKTELDIRKGNALARTAEERRQRPGRAFAEYTSGIRHNDLFEVQKMTVKNSAENVLAAITRTFLKDKTVWTRLNKSLGPDLRVVDADMRSLISKQRVIFLVGQITDDTCEVYFKLWQYTLSGNVQIINGKMTEESWNPVHPSFSSWTPEVVNSQRARDMNALRQRFEAQLNTP